MSAEGLSAFFARLQEDEDLQAEARAISTAPEGERVAALCALAARNGFEVTADDLAAAAAEPGAAALQDESIQSVVGGLGCDVVGFFSGQREPGGRMG